MAQQNQGSAHTLNTVKVILVLITLLALISYPYIPKRTLHVYPEPNFWWGAFTDTFAGGNTQFEYANQSASAIRCTMGDAGPFKLCGNNGVFADGTKVTYEKLVSDPSFAISVSPSITRDFSSFLGIEMDIEYRGPADFIFVSLQNHEPIPDMTDANRQFRPQSVGISTEELHKPVYISLEDFKVSDWWIHQFSLHRKKAVPRFDRIRAIGIEVRDELPHSEHYIKVKSITFVGEWISKESFYFIIIIILASLLLLEGAVRVYSLYASHRATRKSLEELSERNKKLQSAAYKDELTQLLNRRAIYDILLSDTAQAQFIAILVIDIDNFKSFNDTYGHSLGDKVLVYVARALKDSSRDYDQIARWGGEEFVIITKESQPDNLLAYAEKLRTNISSTAIQIENRSDPIYVTVSIGFTIASRSENFETAFERADAALYRAKQNGRNRCVYN